MKKNVEMNHDDFSVLMSVYYNERPEYLELALASVLVDQTVKPTEVILVKDGVLNDELDAVIEKFIKKYPKILKPHALKENVGLGKALQIGLEKCKYDLIMRMDSDDVSAPERFQKQLEFMKTHKDVSAAGGYIGEFEHNPNEELRLKTMPCTFEQVKRYAKMRNPINHVTVCFRKKDILEVGSYQPLHYLEDHYLWARLLVAGKILENIPEILVYVRIGNGFNDRRGSKKYIGGWKKLQTFFYKNHFINYVEMQRNMLGMYTMVYIPPKGRAFLYNNVLRKRKSKKKK